MKIILGSQSKRRQQVLREMGYSFEVQPADVDEKTIRLKDPKKLTLALAKLKATTIISRGVKPAILITSDQVVVWNGKIREKPREAREAREFLLGYNLFPAETVTAVVVTNTKTGQSTDGVDTAKVYFNVLADHDVEELITKGDILDLAGGFTVTGKIWQKHIRKIIGAPDSVMGLPKSLTQQLIDRVSLVRKAVK